MIARRQSSASISLTIRRLTRRSGSKPSCKAFNPISALRGFELPGKYLKLWTDKVEMNEVGDLAERIRSAWKEESQRPQQNAETAEDAQGPVTSTSRSSKPNSRFRRIDLWSSKRLRTTWQTCNQR
jgi:hypothetical protein